MSTDVGSINGKDVSFEEFRLKVSEIERSQQGMTPIMASNRVWDQEIMIALLGEEFEDLGIRVGEDHIIETFKSDPNIGQNPMFLNAAGKFDVAKLKEFFKANPAQAQAFESRQENAALNAKYLIYNGLVKGGLYTTDLEGKMRYEMETTKASFDYVAVPYSSIKDSDAKVTDEEIIAYMRKNEDKYKAEESRVIDYVLVEERASDADQNEIKNRLNSLINGSTVYNEATGKNDTVAGFRTTTNLASFVGEHSDMPYDTTYVAKKDLPAEHADQLFSLASGQVYGPYMRGDYLCISKVIGRKSGATAKASHILISYEGTQVPNKKEQRTKEEAKAKAESLLAQAKANPSGFMMLALTNSDDSSAQQGGDLGFFSEGQMVKPFNDFVFNNSIGTIGLVETDFGYHVINVTDKQDAIKLATIAQRVQPSETTSDEVYNKAVKFEMEADGKDFAAVAKQHNLNVVPNIKLNAMDENFGQIANQRQVVRWAFDRSTSVGDIKRFEVANLGNVIVSLKKVNKKGLMAVDEARPSIEPILKNQKKAEIIKGKLSGNSLDAMAKANNVTIQKATDLTIANAVLPSLGSEPKVVATAISTGANKVSAPIEGNSGVYVVRATAVTKAPALKEHSAYANQIKQQRMNDVGRVVGALRAKADIEDNRALFN